MKEQAPDSGDVAAKRALIGAVASFAAAVLLSVSVLLVAGPRAGTAGLTFEAAKAAMQVLGVAVVGGAISAAVWALQRDRIERFDRAERTRVEHHEDLRRDADRRLEDRRRDDEFLKGVHDHTIASYNSIKKVRRMSTGALRTLGERLAIPRTAYEASISAINDQQLEFERMARQVPLMGDLDLYNRTDSHGRKQNHFRVVEEYLNRILQEYQLRSRSGKEADRKAISLEELPRFRQFLFDISRSRDRFHGPVQRITTALEDRIRRPVDLPATGLPSASESATTLARA